MKLMVGMLILMLTVGVLVVVAITAETLVVILVAPRQMVVRQTQPMKVALQPLGWQDLKVMHKLRKIITQIMLVAVVETLVF